MCYSQFPLSVKIDEYIITKLFDKTSKVALTKMIKYLLVYIFIGNLKITLCDPFTQPIHTVRHFLFLLFSLVAIMILHVFTH